MFFLIRAFFWIGVVVLLMPDSARPPHLSAQLRDARDAVAPAVKVAAAAATSCVREPQACREGVETARRFGTKLDETGRLAMAVFETPLPPPRVADRPKSNTGARRAGDAIAR